MFALEGVPACFRLGKEFYFSSIVCLGIRDAPQPEKNQIKMVFVNQKQDCVYYFDNLHKRGIDKPFIVRCQEKFLPDRKTFLFLTTALKILKGHFKLGRI